MIMETEYRKRALQSLQASCGETKREAAKDTKGLVHAIKSICLKLLSLQWKRRGRYS